MEAEGVAVRIFDGSEFSPGGLIDLSYGDAVGGEGFDLFLEIGCADDETLDCAGGHLFEPVHERESDFVAGEPHLDPLVLTECGFDDDLEA